MEKEFDKIAQKTADGKLKLIDSSAAEKSIDKIDALYSAIIHKFESRGIASAGLKKDQQAISAINVAIKGYAAATKEITTEENKLNAAIEKQERAKEELLEKQKKQTVATHAEIEAQKMKAKSLDEELKKKKDILATTEKELKRKIEESGGKYTEKQLTEKTPQKGPSIKKTDAYRAWKAAMDNVNVTSKGLEQAKLDLGNMATLEEQARAIEAVNEKITEAKKRMQDFLNTTKPGKEQTAFTEIKKQLEEMEGIDWSSFGIDLKEVKNINQLKQALEKVGEAATKNSTILSQQMLEGLRAVGTTANGVGEDVRGATTALKDMDTEAQKAEAFQNRIKSFLGLSGAAQVLRRALRDAMSTITELDATMTEMAVVTDLTVGDYWDQLPEYSKQASELGVAINSAYEAATLYYQQGLKGNEVTKISAETLKMARIAGLSAADATDKMTAALRGFNMELNEASAQKVADVYSQLAAITAADVNEISSAMSKTASIAHSAGMEFETTAAFLAQIVETTRESAETAGTALKTVIARFQELKKDPSEIGEVDGEIVDANKIETALRSVGVALRDSSGQFRELDDVFMELSQKWDTLDTNTQRYIATIAAGSRQQSRFIAMMSDYARTQELVTAANNSAGASQEQFEKTMDSLQSKIEKLKNAWHEFTMGILNSDLVKWGVDVLTKFLEVLNKATSAFKGLGGSITKIASVITIFKIGSKIFDKFKQPISDLFNWVSDESGTVGYRAGKNYAQQFKQGLSEEFTPEETIKETESTEGKDKQPEKKLKAHEKVSTGWNTITGKDTEAGEELKRLKKENGNERKLQRELKKAKQAEEEIKKTGKASGDEIAYAEKATDKAEKNLKNYQEQQKKVFEEGKEGWKQLSEGLAQMGQNAAALGLGISMVGGIISSLGPKFEGVGNAISTVGSAVTMIGTAIGTLGPITTKLVEKLVAGGWSVQAAWWWVAAIGAAIAILASAIGKVAADIKKASPEAKLERAVEAAEAAAQTADEMAAAYHNLVDSLEGIDSQYDTIEDMVYGTKEWQKAVEAVNDEVLELIEEYPELAKFVKNKDGILTINMDSAGVQQVIADAKEVANNARIAATMAEIGRISVQRSNDYDALENSAKLNYIDPDSAYWAAYSGADAAGSAAEEAAEKSNKQGQLATETIARALAAGAIIDTGSGYEATEMLSTDFLSAEDVNRLQALIGDTSGWESLYTQLKGSTEALKEFGTTLNKTSKAEEAQYESLWFQIYNNMDKSSWSEDAKAVGEGAFGAALPSAVAADVWNKYSDVDFLDKNLSDENQKVLNQALEQQYGAGARLTEDADGNQIIVDGNGKTVVDQVNNELLQSLVVASQTATEVEARAAKIPQMTEEVVRGVDAALKNNTGAEGETTVTGNSKDVREAIITALSDQTGESMTFDMAEMFKGLTSEEIKAIYNSSSALQELYADVALFEGVLKTAPNNVEESRKKVEEFFNGFPEWASGLTAKALSGLMDETRLGAVYSTGTDEEINEFETRFNALMDNENAEEIASYLNELDWTNEKDLIKAQYALQNQYGISAEEAKGFTEAAINATDATTELTDIITEFDAFDQALKKTEIALRKFSDLQWEYERILKHSSDAAEASMNIEQQRAAALEAFYAADAAYEAARERQTNKYADGVNVVTGQDLTKLVQFDPTTGHYDTTAFYDWLRGQSEDSETYKEATAWVKELETLNKTALDQNDEMKKAYEQLEAIEEAAKEGYQQLYDQLGEVIISTMEKSIETQENLLDATKEANDRIVDKIQEQINEDRQARENEKTEEELGDMYSKLAYLGMDTSGANELNILDLEKQIAEKEQDYQNNLVDQAIQSLQDANEKAYEQRERQITIAEQQLAAYKLSDEHQAQIEGELNQYLDEYNEYKKEYEDWTRAEDARTMSTEAFVKKYPEYLTEQMQADEDRINTLKESYLNKPTFSAKDTQLGQLMIAAGLVTGMSEIEADQFWKNIENNTANAAFYTLGVDENTVENEELLTAIKTNTAMDALIASQKIGDLKAARETADNIKSDYGFEISGDYDIGDYEIKDDNGRITGYDVSGMQSQIDRTETINSNLSKLDASAESTNTYNSFGKYIKPNGSTADVTDKIGAKPMSMQEYYNALSTDGRVMVGTTPLSYTNLEKFLADEGGSEDDYDRYIQLFKQTYGPEESMYINLDIIDNMKAIIDERSQQNRFRGWSTVTSLEEYNRYKEAYQDHRGNPHVFDSALRRYIQEKVNYGSVSDVEFSPDSGTGSNWYGTITIKGESFQIEGESVDKTRNDELDEFEGGSTNGWVCFYDGELYYASGEYTYSDGSTGSWWRVKTEGEPLWFEGAFHNANKLKEYYKKILAGYKTGGLADFTGPAWLDGTKSKPEIVLNQRDSANFIVLRDILGEVLNGTSTINNNSNTQQKYGDNHFDIEINVEKLENDYDVEQIANKIRSMIYEDATYRNVNAIGMIR